MSPISRASIVLAVCFFTVPVTAYNLTCYSCNTNNKEDDCFTNATLSEEKDCLPSEKYCMVHRIETVGVFSSLERSCAVTCKASCGVWGEEQDQDHCKSCCMTSLCNTDNAGTNLCGNFFSAFMILCVVRGLSQTSRL